MDLSVVVATLNGRDALVDCLDALAAVAPATERIVVNGPSADGTTGMVRERDDVDVLVELADRNINVARNAGAEAATGDVVAFVDDGTLVQDGWLGAIERSLTDAPVVTGPVRRPLPVGSETSRPVRSRVAGRPVTFFDGSNVAFVRRTIARLDGFDEYLAHGGARDAAHRLAGLGLEVDWSEALAARREQAGMAAPPRTRYRGLGYHLAKNYGLSPAIMGRLLGSAGAEGGTETRSMLAGETLVSRWIGDGVGVAAAGTRGVVDGLLARRRDPRPARNPNGISARTDRPVRRYEWK